MSQQPELHPISLQYQVRTSKQGYQEVERLLPLLGELQNAGITDLRQHDPDFANIARRLAVSVVKRVNDAYHRAYTVPNAGCPRTESPYGFRTLEISEPANKHVKFRRRAP